MRTVEATTAMKRLRRGATLVKLLVIRQPGLRRLVHPTRLRTQQPIFLEVSDEYARPWTDPNPDQRLPMLLNPANGNKDCVKQAFGGNHGTIFAILFADGHVRFYCTNVDPKPLYEVFIGVLNGTELEQ